MSTSPCCLKAFQWDGNPTGRTATLADTPAYIAGADPSAAVLLIHDLLGWSFPNTRLLADHYAAEARATVFVPDLFAGASLDRDLLLQDRWAELDVAGFLRRNGREAREPDVFRYARALREMGYARVGAVGFCYGGWAAFRLAAAEHSPPLVDCVSAGHPSLLTRADVEGLAGGEVPVQVLAPERDAAFTAELKARTLEVLQARGAAFDYQHFPGVEHGCLVRGDAAREGEREAMERGKDVVVAWLRQHLHGG